MRHTTPVPGVPDSLTWAVLTLAYAGRPSSPVPARLPRPGPSRSVPFTNPFTPTHPDDPPGTCTSPSSATAMPPRSSAPAQLRSGPADHAARHPPHRCHPQAREDTRHPGGSRWGARLAGVHLHTGRATIEGTGNRRMTDAAPPHHTGTAARTCRIECVVPTYAYALTAHTLSEARSLRTPLGS